MDKKNWIVVDLDGTLCDCSHRVHLAQAKDWEAFHELIHLDKPREDVALLLQMALKLGHEVLVVTGRPAEHFKATENWLRRNGLTTAVTEICMRNRDDRRADHDIKIGLAIDFFGSVEKMREQVMFVLDDRDRVVEAWRNAGVPCWQVNAGAY